MTTSARCPSTSASTQIEEIRRAWPAVIRTSLTRPIASARARERFPSAAPRARTQRDLDVDRPHDAVLRGVDRQLDDAHPALVVREHPCRFQTFPAVRAEAFQVRRVAAEVAALDDIVLREQPGEGADRG